MRRSRNLLLVAVVLSLAAFLAACGGSGDSGGAADLSPQQVLDQTFAPGKSIKSAKLNAVLSISTSGGGGKSTDFSATLSGVVNALDPKAPQFDLSTKIDGEQNGQSTSLEAGAILTDSAAYLTYSGQNYELGADTFNQFKAGLDQSAQQQGKSTGLGSQADIKNFLTNVTDEGTEDVAGTESVHVSGDVDVNKLVTELRPLLQAAGSLDTLGGAAGQLPNVQDLSQLENSIKSASFDVYSSTADNQLTRFVLDLEIKEPTSGDSKIGVDVTLSDVGDDLAVTTPTESVPLDELLGGLGLGGASGVAPSGAGTDSGAGAGGSGGGSTPSPATPDGLKKYQDCLGTVTRASDLEKCQKLLS